MKLKILAGVLMLASLNAFAGNTEASGISCTSERNPNFRLDFKFDQKTNAINDTGYARVVNASASITLSRGGKIKTANIGVLNLSQGPSYYGYELRFQRMILNSNYPSHMSIQPEFKKSMLSGPTLIKFSGVFEINAMIDGDDIMIKDEDLVCAPIV